MTTVCRTAPWKNLMTALLLLLSYSTTNAFVVPHTTAQLCPRTTPPTFRLASNLGDDHDSSQAKEESSRRTFLESIAKTTTTAATVTAVATANGVVTSASATSSIPSALPEWSSHAVPSVLTATATTAASLKLPPMGLGAWAWGDSLFWGYDAKNDEELRRVFDTAVTLASKSSSSSSSLLLDTAEIYGFGRSEKLIGEFSKPYAPDSIQVATKFAALPWCTKASDVVKACEKSLARLGRPIDLYQIHFPNAWSNEAYWDGLATAYDKGLVRAVGVSNYSVDATRACHAALAKRGIALSTNQIQLSLLYRWPLSNGLAQACDDLGVQVLSYSPLALGMLTGKYTPDNMPSGPRKKLYQNLISSPDYNNLLATMNDVAEGHGSATTRAQVALNWNRAKGTIPIPGARTVNQVQSNYGALDWSMSAEEVKVLDAAASKVTTFITPEQNPFPKKDKDTGLIMYDS